jgi:RNA polymerase sigma-54 factor
MAFAPRLDLRQTQSLVMTPQLRQAIQLLQYSNLEASQFIEDELLKNPLLERVDGAETVTAIEAAADGAARRRRSAGQRRASRAPG